jgi:hypothetical protein
VTTRPALDSLGQMLQKPCTTMALSDVTCFNTVLRIIAGGVPAAVTCGAVRALKRLGALLERILNRLDTQ